MKYSTALGHLRSVAADLSSLADWEGFPIVEAHVYGDVLELADTVNLVSLALVVDRPVEEVTWYARPAHLEAVASQLRLDKLPISWRWRPSAWPAWNYEIVGPVRIWSKDDGADESALDALSHRRLAGLRSGPSDDLAFEQQLRTELEAARRHLASVVDSYHEREWRREHKGFGVYPEDHLWWAAAGVLDLEAALRRD